MLLDFVWGRFGKKKSLFFGGRFYGMSHWGLRVDFG